MRPNLVIPLRPRCFTITKEGEERGGGKGGTKTEEARECAISSDCYFAALEFFTEWGEDEITESDGLLSYRGMIPYGDITHPTDQQFLDRYFYRGGKGEARTKSDSVLLFFLRFSSSTERSVSSAKRPRRYTYSRNCRSGRNKPFPGTDQSADRTLISRESIDRHIFFFFPSPRKKKRDHEYRERREVVLRKKRGSSSLFRESNLTWRDHEARPDLEEGRRATVCIYIYILYAILLVHFLVRES